MRILRAQLVRNRTLLRQERKHCAPKAFQRFQQDLQANIAVASVFSSTDVGHFPDLKKRGLLQAYRPHNLPNMGDDLKQYNDKKGLQDPGQRAYRGHVMSISTSFKADARCVSLTARPEPLNLTVAETALIVVDMQNAYASQNGYLDLAGFDISGAQPAIEKITEALKVARQCDMTVIYLQNGWDRDYVEAGGPGSPNWHKSNALKTMRKRPELQGTLLSKGGWDYEFVDALKPQSGDFVVAKSRYSGFFNTRLDSLLRSRGIRNMALCGIATNVCVESTLRDGFFLEYFGVLLEDATHQAGPDFLQRAAVYNIETFFGWVTSTSEFCHAFAAG